MNTLIIGGGLVGALAACVLADQHPVTLVESQLPHLDTPPTWDERCVALNAASVAFLSQHQLLPEGAPILHTHISERGRLGVARFSAEEAGLPVLGRNVPLRALGQMFWRRLHRLPVTVVQASLLAVEGREAVLSNGQRLGFEQIIGADGAQSPLRAALGWTAEVRDYQQSATVTAVRCQKPHQGVAYERFTPDGPIALLPKTDDPHTCSLIWTRPLQAPPLQDFLSEAQHTFGERLGAFRSLGASTTYPLRRTVSQTLQNDFALLIGNAAQSLHPVAGQGFNLGLRDVMALRQGFEGHADRRAADRQRTVQFTDHLVRLFSNRLPLLSQLRSLGLLGLAGPWRQAVLQQNLGLLL
jgi:2-octaprenyl-6-methoxyphenol hydroxylase